MMPIHTRRVKQAIQFPELTETNEAKILKLLKPANSQELDLLSMAIKQEVAMSRAILNAGTVLYIPNSSEVIVLRRIIVTY